MKVRVSIILGVSCIYLRLQFLANRLDKYSILKDGQAVSEKKRKGLFCFSYEW